MKKLKEITFLGFAVYEHLRLQKDTFLGDPNLDQVDIRGILLGGLIEVSRRRNDYLDQVDFRDLVYTFFEVIFHTLSALQYIEVSLCIEKHKYLRIITDETNNFLISRIVQEEREHEGRLIIFFRDILFIDKEELYVSEAIVNIMKNILSGNTYEYPNKELIERILRPKKQEVKWELKDLSRLRIEGLRIRLEVPDEIQKLKYLELYSSFYQRTMKEVTNHGLLKRFNKIIEKCVDIHIETYKEENEIFSD